MKYRLNLYTSRFQTKHLLLDRRLLIVCVALVSLLLLVSGIWLNRINQKLADEQRVAISKRTEMEARVLELSRELGARAENSDLLNSIAVESRAVTGKRQLIKRLSSSPLLADTRFSRYMRGLSNSHVQGLWLTRVRTDGGSLILDGRSLSEDLLPQWIHQLSLQVDFQGKKFGLLELIRPKDTSTTHLDFHLSTQLKRDEVENG